MLSSTKKTILSVSLTTLTDRTLHHSSDSASTESLWTQLKDVPYYHTTAATIGGSLMALGGTDKPRYDGTINTSIHTYHPTSSTWLHTGELPSPLRRSTSILLPTNELLIIGGSKTGSFDTAKQVLKGTIQL